jgi:hypothetical protein
MARRPAAYRCGIIPRIAQSKHEEIEQRIKNKALSLFQFVVLSSE